MTKTYYDYYEVTQRLNSNSWDDRIALMERADEFDTALMGTNEDGENVMVSINSDNITITTFQENDWCRTITYYNDFTIEEGFEKA